MGLDPEILLPQILELEAYGNMSSLPLLVIFVCLLEPGSYCVFLAGLEFTKIHLPLFSSARIKGVYYYLSLLAIPQSICY